MMITKTSPFVTFWSTGNLSEDVGMQKLKLRQQARKHISGGEATGALWQPIFLQSLSMVLSTGSLMPSRKLTAHQYLKKW